MKVLKQISLLSLAISLMTGCMKQTTKNDVETIHNFVLDFTHAIKNPEESMKLSELADSITYVPLETTPQSLLGNVQRMNFQSKYIFYDNYCFDWNGKFIRRIGNVGQGPCEEFYAQHAKMLYHNGFFYGNGSKIIQYNNEGECTGRERSWYMPKEDPNMPMGNYLTNMVCFSSAQNNLMVFNYPDTVYFFNTDFNVISKRSIMPWNSSKIAHATTAVYDKFISYYNDTTLFYNFYTDTVFTVTSNSLESRYVIKLDDQIKVPREFLYDYTDLLGDAFNYWERGMIDQCRMVQLVDHKYRIMGVYETNSYIFVLITELIAFRELRKIPQSNPMLGIYRKEDGKINVVKRIEDDLGGLKNFFPSWGACNEKLIRTIWPHQLQNFLEEEKGVIWQDGQMVTDLMNRVKEDDNPILIMAHLKQK